MNSKSTQDLIMTSNKSNNWFTKKIYFFKIKTNTKIIIKIITRQFINKKRNQELKVLSTTKKNKGT